VAEGMLPGLSLSEWGCGGSSELLAVRLMARLGLASGGFRPEFRSCHADGTPGWPCLLAGGTGTLRLLFAPCRDLLHVEDLVLELQALASQVAAHKPCG